MTEDTGNQRDSKVTNVGRLLLEQAIDAADRSLAALEVPLRERTFKVAMLVADSNVREIAGEEKGDDPAAWVKRPWFALVFKEVSLWYHLKYGKKAIGGDTYMRGVVIVRGTPVELHIPTTKSEPAENADTRWFTILDGLDESDRFDSWIDSGIRSIEAFPGECEDIRKTMGAIASPLRRINSILLTTKGDTKAPEVVPNVRAHILIAADTLLNRDTGLTVWHAHQLVEWSLKLVKMSRDGEFQPIHFLDRLHADASTHLVGVPDPQKMSEVPTWHDAKTNRCGETPRPPLSSAWKMYAASLQYAADILSHVKREVRVGGAKFKIQSPPWQRYQNLEDSP